MKSIKIPNNTKKGYLECCEKGVFDVSYPSSKNRRGRVQEGGGGDTDTHGRRRKLNFN